MKNFTKIITIIVAVIVSLSYTANAQVSINTDGSNPDASAMLDVKSTNKGFLPPRVANIYAVSNPATGLQVYDISNHCMRYYNGSSWSDCLGIKSTDGNITCGGTISDLNGNTYTTVQIGTQCWMAENLNAGTMINGSINQIGNGTIEKYCFDDDTTNCDTYGGLYQWDEMMQYVTTAGTQGICPTGWHLPTDAEWTTLTNYAGGLSVAGGKLKETGTTHWLPPNTGATNKYDFTNLPAGYRSSTGSFSFQTSIAYTWSSTQTGTSAYGRRMHFQSASVNSWSFSKDWGLSVRCIRD